MSHKLRFYVIVAMLALSLPIYLILMASCEENNLFLRIARLPGGFVVVLGILLVFAWAVSAILDISFILKRVFIKPKLGHILVSDGYITEEELKQALSHQDHKIGQVLVDGGRITMDQLNQALDRKKEDPMKIGEILKEIGYATDEDINWALAKMKRRIGQILLDMGLLTHYDVGRALGKQRKL